MNQKRTNKTTSTSPSQSNSQTSTKKTTQRKSKKTVSSNTALILSLGVLALCVVMLGVSFVLTQKNTPQTVVKSEVEKTIKDTSANTEKNQISKSSSNQQKNSVNSNSKIPPKQNVQNVQSTKKQNTNKKLQVAKS